MFHTDTTGLLHNGVCLCKTLTVSYNNYYNISVVTLHTSRSILF